MTWDQTTQEREMIHGSLQGRKMGNDQSEFVGFKACFGGRERILASATDLGREVLISVIALGEKGGQGTEGTEGQRNCFSSQASL